MRGCLSGGMASIAVEDYLKQILLLAEGSGGLVTTGALAASLEVVPGTVTTCASCSRRVASWVAVFTPPLPRNAEMFGYT